MEYPLKPRWHVDFILIDILFLFSQISTFVIRYRDPSGLSFPFACTRERVVYDGYWSVLTRLMHVVLSLSYHILP